MNNTTLSISIFITILVVGVSVVYFSGGFRPPHPNSYSTTSTNCFIYSTIEITSSTLNNGTIIMINHINSINGTQLINTYDQFGNYFNSSCINNITNFNTTMPKTQFYTNQNESK